MNGFEPKVMEGVDEDDPDFKWVIFLVPSWFSGSYVIDTEKKIRVAKDAVPFPNGERISGLYTPEI